MSNQKHTLLFRLVAESLTKAVAEGDKRKAKLAADQFVLLVDELAKDEATPDPDLVLNPDSDEACWDQLVAVARFLDEATNYCDLSSWIDLAVDELVQFGRAKQRKPEVVARLVEIEKVRSRMLAFIGNARGFVKDIENLYGCSLKDIRRYRSEGGGQ